MPSPPRSPCHEAALRYREEWGWNTLPLCPPDHAGVADWHKKACRSPGKVPYLRTWKRYMTERLPERLLHETFAALPGCNVGVVMGPTSCSSCNGGGLVALDVDGPEAWRHVLGLLPEAELRRTPCFATARGLRLLYRVGPGEALRNYTWSFPNGGSLLLMGTRGLQSVCPPSVHSGGLAYEWVHRLPTELRLPACLQPPVGEPAVARDLGRPRQQPHPLRSVELQAPIRTGVRNRTLFRRSTALRRHGATLEELLACLRIFNRRCEPPLEDRELESIARSAARYPPLEEQPSV